MIIVIATVALIILFASVSYAFFNYTKTGSVNVLAVGNIYLEDLWRKIFII